MRRRPDPVALLLLAAAGVTLAVRIVTHEMWFDELQAWSIVRDNSPLGVLRALGYESHPPLWYLVLWPVSRLTRDPRAMQVVQFALAMGTAAVIVLWSPFRRWQQAALLFGYFLGFEYGALSRSYGLGVLLLAAALALASVSSPRWKVIGAFLGLACLTSVMAVFVAGAITVGLLVRERRAIPALMGPALLGAVLTAVSLRPASDIGRSLSYIEPSFTPQRAFVASSRVWRALVPIPSTKPWPWNTNILDPGHHIENNPFTDVAYSFTMQRVLGLFLMAAVAAVLWRNRAAFTVWVTGVLGLMVFSLFVVGLGMRHTGHFFLVFLAAVWMAGTHSAGSDGDDAGQPIVTHSLVSVLLLAQLGAALALTAQVGDRPFSQGRAVAAMLRHDGLDGRLIVVDSDIASAATATWLDRPVWFANAQRFGRYPVFDKRRERRGDAARYANVVEVARDAPNPSGRPVVLVLNYPLEPGPGLELYATFAGDVALEKGYWVYVLDVSRPVA
ncbi:MAG TPA: hypothetical protein VM030_01040 [Acidimicrobiales bacterium]|nr:hypothetical protein [Acidimicrobiales bacterium]